MVRANFRRYGLSQPTTHPGWFTDTLPGELPPAISFAHLDGDLYEPIMESLRHTYPRLSSGAVCVVDDYCDPNSRPDGWNHLPGVKRPCDEFFVGKREHVAYTYSGNFSHGFFRKL